METIIFGGTFDPPTKAHETIIQACLDRPEAHEVWVMPSGHRVDKLGMQVDETRLAMLAMLKQQAFQNNPRLVVSDFEMRLLPPTRTTDTVQALRLAYPDRQFRFVFGADSYQDMPHWQDGVRLQGELALLLVAREGYELPAATARLQHLALPTGHVVVSSTMVRQRAQQGQAIDSYVNPSIVDYITDHRLYAAVQ